MYSRVISELGSFRASSGAITGTWPMDGMCSQDLDSFGASHGPIVTIVRGTRRVRFELSFVVILI